MREVWGVCAAVALVACSGLSGEDDRDTPDEGRGTAACRQWQDSVCDWAVRCQALEREECDSQFQGVTCRSDTSAKQCAEAWDRASCFQTPPSCSLDSIADPGPAARACDALTEHFCERSTECGISVSEDACLDAEQVDCSRSVAYRLDYETCIDRIEEIDCEQVRLPAICESVIISRP